jgi:tetratricopeptide (TPR) repeat protein
MPAPEYAVALGDLLTAMGRRHDAAKQDALVEQMARLSRASESLYGRELAYFHLDRDLRVEEALAMARREREVRRDVYAHDLLAWALLKNGRVEEARQAIAEALRLGTRDPKLFFHAGLIHARLGDTARARDYLSRALALNPNFHVLHAPAAARALEALDVR